jgi:hypothetical protein
VTAAVSTATRVSKGKERARRIRSENWPAVGPDLLWDRKRCHGFTTTPRTLPILMNIIDSQSKNQPAGRTYFGLWARSYDEAIVIVENPMSLAAEAGFGGERAVTTWKQRMKTLSDLGFIDAHPGTTGEFHYVLIYNPHKVVWKLREQIPNQYFMQLIDRCAEIGAADMVAPVPALLAKKKHKSGEGQSHEPNTRP